MEESSANGRLEDDLQSNGERFTMNTKIKVCSKSLSQFADSSM